MISIKTRSGVFKQKKKLKRALNKCQKLIKRPNFGLKKPGRWLNVSKSIRNASKRP